MGVQSDAPARFEITHLEAADDPVTHTADAAEISALVTWAYRHGVKVRVRPLGPASDNPDADDGRHTVSNDSKDQAARPEGGRDIESWKEKGVALRAFFYIFGTHLFAGFIWLLFYVGQHANK